MTPLKESPYSYHFNALTNLGSWITDTKDPVKLNLYAWYRLMVAGSKAYGLYGLFLDLYLAAGDMKKMSWNICVTTLLLGMVFKGEIMAHRNGTVNGLRGGLHRDAESRRSPEDLAIHALALREFKVIRVAFYGTAVLFMPAWFFGRYSGYFYGARELPIPFPIPKLFDIERDFDFHFAYITLGSAAIVGMMTTMEMELSMYGLLVQISREYAVLIKDIPEISRMYECDEVNPALVNTTTRSLVKKFGERQKTLIGYTETFEFIFNEALLQQFFGMSILIVALALQCLWESVDFSGNLLYQVGYLFINLMDMFLMCHFSTRLRTQCLKVGDTFYATLWYEMPVDIQRDILFIMMRSQHPPKITIGKFAELNLPTFMSTMSHLYSWLALFRQLE